MATIERPLPVGTPVHHSNQIWSAAAHVATGVIEAVKGPYYDGSFEYQVLTGEDFGRRPGPDNPQTRTTWWSSLATIPVGEDRDV
jgi:hypothetical protein